MTIAGRIRYEIGSRRPRNRQPDTPSAYRRELLKLVHTHIAETHPETLPLDEWVETAERHLGLTTSRAVSVLVGDLWTLFEPDFRERLPAYYAAQAQLLMLRFIDYATDEKFIREHYAHPYELAAARLGRLHGLEIGGGIPHGLIRLQLEQPGKIASAAFNDIDAPYTRFALWFCRSQGIPADWLPAVAGEASELPGGRYNFVFAKDVLEHLHDPDRMLEQILSAVTDDAVLALDLDDKGARVYQHVNPELSPLRRLLDGWHEFGRSGNVTLLTRR